MLLYLHIFYIVLCIFMSLNFKISLKMSLLKWLIDIIFFLILLRKELPILE